MAGELFRKCGRLLPTKIRELRPVALRPFGMNVPASVCDVSMRKSLKARPDRSTKEKIRSWHIPSMQPS
ncbi:MAG: hypothetical protein JWN14_4561 [Chthonomonadales bacterium]|nr:hypothetical protein [Chthonomonadales bacterium]